MAKTPSTMLPLGTKLPSFRLPDTDGKFVSTAEVGKHQPVLVMFICNHCPFVVHVADELTKLTADFIKKGGSVLAVSANDAQKYPADGPEAMAKEKAARGYPFPYLYDETQAVAKAYQAACTPDFYLFDSKHLLVYRGQLDDSRPANGLPVTGKDLRNAINAVLTSQAPLAVQKPSIGCNIKWKPGNEPPYYPPR